MTRSKRNASCSSAAPLPRTGDYFPGSHVVGAVTLFAGSLTLVMSNLTS
jgi:hypothetical protein